MKTALQQFFHWIAQSFSGGNEVSARRLTAFNITAVYTIGSMQYMVKVSDPQWLWMKLMLDALFVLLLFGIVTFQQITELKNGKS